MLDSSRVENDPGEGVGKAECNGDCGTPWDHHLFNTFLTVTQSGVAMAAEFIGYAVLVTLRSPTNAQIQGIVADVGDQCLVLRDVLWSGQRIPTYTIRSDLIADLELSSSQPLENELVTPTAIARNILPVGTPAPDFIDPAILSFTKRKDPPRPLPTHSNTLRPPPLVSPVMIADQEVLSQTGNSKIHAGESSISSITSPKPTESATRKDSTATATLTEPFDSMAISTTQDLGTKAQKKTKRKDGKKDQVTSQPDPRVTQDVSTVNVNPKKGRGKGWRQGPLVQDMAPKRGQKPRHRRKSYAEDPNGWATEDATDIQDMGEFDFGANLSKFDKRQVFDEIRRDDATAANERLVNMNRKARPGTDGGRNLHFTDNVLDPELKSEGDAGDEEIEELYSSGRGSKRLGPPSRKGSLFPPMRTESPRGVSRRATASPLNGSLSGNARVSLRMEKTNKPCPTISPLQMLEIEQLCTSELGMTESLLNENGGRGIAEVIAQAQPKSVIFLVGNHKTGARSIVAARHLRNRRFRVTVVLLGGEREDSFLEPVRNQLSMYRKISGYVERWDSLQMKLAAGPQPDIIVDALMPHVAFDELRTDDQAVVLEMIRWANRSSAATYSIDVPSGLSATTGLVGQVEGGDTLVIDAAHVLCMGAPKTGLVNAEIATEWQISVLDLGIPPAAWQKYGSRRRHGVEFGSEWIVQLKVTT